MRLEFDIDVVLDNPEDYDDLVVSLDVRGKCVGRIILKDYIRAKKLLGG